MEEKVPPRDNKVSTSIVNGIATLMVSFSAFDIYVAPLVREPLQAGLKDPEVTGMVIDLEEVQDLDSTAIGVLLGGQVTASRNKKEFALKNPTPRVRSTLAVKNLDKFFSIILQPESP